MPQLRVLHITDCYDGGVLTSINNYVKSNPAISHSLMYVNLGTKLEVHFSQVHEFDSKSWIRRYLQYKIVDESGLYDVIHVHSSRAGALTRMTRSKTRLVFQPHGISFAQPRHKIIQKVLFWIEKYLAKNTDAFIAVSPHERANVRRLNKRARVYVVRNFSELEGKRSSKRFVLMIGRVIDLKGPDFFLEVSKLSSFGQEKTNFVWIGDGDKDLVAKLEQSGVMVTGWLGKAEIESFLSQALAYLHTSVSEGFPISLLDAVNFEVPVIVRSIEAFEDYDLKKVQSAGEASKVLHDLVSDESFEDTLVQKSINLAAQHTPTAMRDSYIEVLESLEV